MTAVFHLANMHLPAVTETCFFLPCSFSSRGFYLEGGSIFSSLLLLVVLLALTFQRILGLDRFINKALQ